MTTRMKQQNALVTGVRFHKGTMIVELRDGRKVSVPLAWYPRLARATPAQRRNWQLSGRGLAIRWPQIDENISVESILSGQPSVEDLDSPEPRSPRASGSAKPRTSKSPRRRPPSFSAIIQRDGKWWVGWVAEVPGVNSQGRNRAELLKNLRDALREALEISRAEARTAAERPFEEVSISA